MIHSIIVRKLVLSPVQCLSLKKQATQSNTKSRRKVANSIWFWLSFPAGTREATEKQRKTTKKSRRRIVKSGVRLVPGFLCLLAPGDPPGASLKVRKKTEKVKASARIWTSFSFRRTSKRIEQKPILRWNSNQNPWCKTTALSQNSQKIMLRE